MAHAQKHTIKQLPHKSSARENGVTISTVFQHGQKYYIHIGKLSTQKCIYFTNEHDYLLLTFHWERCICGMVLICPPQGFHVPPAAFQKWSILARLTLLTACTGDGNALRITAMCQQGQPRGLLASDHNM